MKIIEEYDKTEKLKVKAFEKFMESVLEAFQFNLDPTDASKLDVFNIRDGNIWDLENFSTKVSAIGINLFKNFAFDPF